MNTRTLSKLFLGIAFAYLFASWNPAYAQDDSGDAPNLLKNSGMDEADKKGSAKLWKDFSWGDNDRTFTIVKEPGGNNYLRIQINKMVNGWIRLGQKIEIQPGKMYQGSVRLKSDKADAPVRFGLMSQAGNASDIAMETLSVGDEWQTYTFIADYSHPRDDVWIYIATTVKCELCIDDFKLVEVSNAVSKEPVIEGNHVVGGSFEGGVDHLWGIRYRASPYLHEIKTLYLNPKVDRVEGGPHGQYALKLEVPAKSRLYLRSIPLIANYGRTHQMRLFAKKSGGNLECKFGVGSDKVDFSSLAKSFEPGDDWKEYTSAGKIKINKRSQYYVSIDVVAHDEPAVIYLDGVSLIESEKPDFKEKYPASIFMDAKQPGFHLYTVDQSFTPEIKLYGVETNLPSGMLKMTITDIFGNTVTLPPVSIKGGSRMEGNPLLVEKRPGKTGIFKTKLSFVSQKGTDLAPPYEFLFEVIPDLTKKTEYEVPFATHADPTPEDLDALWKLGFRWLRLHDASSVVSKSIIQSKDGKYEFADEVIERLRSKGFKLLGLLNGDEDYMRVVMERYRNKIEAYEVFNEPFYYWLKTRTAEDYVKHLDSALKLAHENGAITVGICGSTHDKVWSSAIWKAGGLDHYDIFSFHGYVGEIVGSDTDRLTQGVNFFKSETDKYGGSHARVWDTEGGSRCYPSWYDDVQLEKPRLSTIYNVKHLVASYVMRQALGVEKFFVYTSHSGRFPSDTEGYCVLEHDRSVPKPAAATIPFLFDFIYGYQVTGTKLVNGVRLVEYKNIKNPSDIHIVGWSIKGIGKLSLKDAVDVTDVMGNARGSLKDVSFDDFPLYLISKTPLNDLINSGD